MPASPRRLAAVAIVLVALTAAGCAGDDERPLRIGVLVDCLGPFRSSEDASLAGAELPLLERGARLVGRRPADGVTKAQVAGHTVELVHGCVEGGELTTVIDEARRLVELEHVDAVVGGTWPGDGIAMRAVAQRYPDVAFMPASAGPREVTLQTPASNLFRVAPDYVQVVAGLAAYAYRELGWRRVAVVADDWEGGWAGGDAFAAEFCSLGGRVARRSTIGFGMDDGDLGDVRTGADGVAVLASRLFDPTQLLRRLAREADDPARELVLGPFVTYDGSLRRSVARELEGVVGSAVLPPPGTPTLDAYLRAYREAFPGLPADAALGDYSPGYRDAVETIVQAFERADGDLSRGRERFRAELAAPADGLLRGSARLDRNRQAMVATPLVRLNRDGSLTRIGAARPVDQSLGGLLAPSFEPRRSEQTC
jgi:branched-chain amino acid transport system substrate-binding protein